MGCCFSTLTQEDDAKTSSALLAAVQPIPSYNSTTVARSARPQIHPTINANFEPGFIQIKTVGVESVEKTLRACVQPYNEIYRCYWELLIITLRTSQQFPEQNREKTVRGCFVQLKNVCGHIDGQVNVHRPHQYCMEIKHDEDRTFAPVVTSIFADFNKANLLIKSILDKRLAALDARNLAIRNEEALRRDILLADLKAEGPSCMKNFIENMEMLKRVPVYLQAIQERALAIFEELKMASNVFFFGGESFVNTMID